MGSFCGGVHEAPGTLCFRGMTKAVRYERILAHSCVAHHATSKIDKLILFRNNDLRIQTC